MILLRKTLCTSRGAGCRLDNQGRGPFREGRLFLVRVRCTSSKLRLSAMSPTIRIADGNQFLGFHTEQGQSPVHNGTWHADRTCGSTVGKRAKLALGHKRDGLRFIESTIKDLGT